MTPEFTQATDPWSALWQTGVGASCFEASDIELHLASLWGEHVDKLPDNARMLDLATGNGTVARTCAAHAAKIPVQIEIDAIDAADIDPTATLPENVQSLNIISFHGATHLEALPFRDGMFDSVVSQFGFEYACETRSASEAARVLKPGGQLRFVIHAQTGAVARDIAERLGRMQSVLAENGPVSLVLELARANESGDIDTVKEKSEELQTALTLVKFFRSHPLQDDSALFYSVEALMLWANRNKYTPTSLRVSIEHGWANINYMAVRQEQMLNAVRSKADIERLGQRLVTFGLRISDVARIKDPNGMQIAWKLDAVKPG